VRTVRTTVTLDDDLAAELQRLARERGAAFKDVLNATIRAGLGRSSVPREFRVRSKAMGLRPGVDLTRALQIASEDEDAETRRKLALRK
jgi:predicted transcriptional regulator